MSKVWRWCTRCHRIACTPEHGTWRCGGCVGILVPFRDQAMADTVYRLGGWEMLQWHARHVDRFICSAE